MVIFSLYLKVILCAKEVNEKTRALSFKLVVKLGYAAHRCYLKNAEGTHNTSSSFLFLVIKSSAK